MKSRSLLFVLLISLCLLFMTAFEPEGLSAAEDSPTYNLPKGVHMDLNKDFYDSLKDNTRQGETKVHTNDPSMVYFKMVLKNQEEIIQKLNLLLEKQR